MPPDDYDDVSDLSDQQVREWFQYIVSRQPIYHDIKSNYEEEILEESDGEEIERKKLESEIKEDRRHDEQLKSTISLFLPNGEIGQNTNWKFLGAEPLVELGEKNADAVFGNPERGEIILVECKTGISKPGVVLNDLHEAAEAVREERTHLSNNIDMNFDDIELVVCVLSFDEENIVQEIERREQENEELEHVYVWRWHYLGREEEERIDLFTRFETRSEAEATHDNEISQYLRSGVEFIRDQETVPSLFPSTHLFIIIEEVFSEILDNHSQDEDLPIRYFGAQEVKRILTSQYHLPHYDAQSIGSRLFDELFSKMDSLDLVAPIDPEEAGLDEFEDCYRYRVNGRSMGTILSNLKERYKQQEVRRKIEIKAMRRTISDYDDDQFTLGDFD